jgi:predicted MPP superfamily phosphohydrolase
MKALAALALALAAGHASGRWLRVRRERMTAGRPGATRGPGAARGPGATGSPGATGRPGFKILHLTDIHFARGKSLVNFWPALERWEFDLAALTGDLLLARLEDRGGQLGHLKRLARRAPVFFCEGNHEQFYFRHMARTLEACGVRPLYNEGVTLALPGGPVRVVGLRDYAVLREQGFAGVARAFGRADPSAFTLVLSHQPQIFDKILRFQPDLVLAGHTHGGQVRLPLLPTLYAPGQGLLPRYGEGWYTRGNSKMFVSKGLGVTVFPLRLFNRPEVAVIEVRFK